MIDKLISNRKEILFIELAGLLHDIGKLSKAFLEYRQQWQDYNVYPDPHVDNFFDTIHLNLFQTRFPQISKQNCYENLIPTNLKNLIFHKKSYRFSHEARR